jgi:trans-2,3-dihydro-3-hydroxyanthranilate isomerase
MAEIEFVLVDVFASTPLAGNPLALVPDADPLPEALLPRIAGELNQPETSFLLTPTAAGADWRVRSYTAAGVEVFGAGHNALGAWWWLAAAGRLDGPPGRRRWHQQLGDAVLPLDIHTAAGEPVRVAMRQHPPTFGAQPADLDRLAAALGLPRDALGAHPDLPVAQVVSTGAPHLMTGVRGRAAVDAAHPDQAALAAVLRPAGAQGCYVYALDPAEPEAAVHARFFNPVAGIPEDPATGSAAGPLACLLAHHGLAGSEVVIAQGHAMGRPSHIQVTVEDTGPVLLGSAALSARGLLHLP